MLNPLVRSVAFTIIVLSLSNLEMHAQSIVISGTVVGADSITIVGGLVSIDGSIVAVTDSDGRYAATVTPGSHTIDLTYLGYEPFTSTADIVSDTTVVDIVLIPTAYDLQSVTVTAKAVNLLQDASYNILDAVITQGQLLVLARKGRRTALHRCTSHGRSLDQQKVDGQYVEMRQSCLGAIWLLGDKQAQQAYTESTISIEQYHTTIGNCVATSHDRLVFSHYGMHKNSLVYYYYDDHYRQIPIIRMMDREGLVVSSSYARDIIGAYLVAVETDDPDAIDFGMIKHNKIADATWSGDLRDLAISNGAHLAYSRYEALKGADIVGNYIDIDDSAYVLDWHRGIIATVTPAWNCMPVDSIPKSIVYRDLISVDGHYYYLLADDKQVYRLDDIESSVQFTSIGQLPNQAVDMVGVLDGQLYYITLPSRAAIRKRLVAMSIDE